jgi:hypothetical protein
LQPTALLRVAAVEQKSPMDRTNFTCETKSDEHSAHAVIYYLALATEEQLPAQL